MLELASFPPPHTGNAVAELVQKVFLNWDLKVPIIVTDNGSNMVKAFKHVKANHAEEVIDSVAKNSIDKEEESEPNLYSDMSDVELDFAEFEEEFSDALAQDNIPSSSTRDDIDLLDEDDDNTAIEIENDQVEFLQFEVQVTQHLQAIFPQYHGETEEEYLKRLSCLSHKLQLVMSTFDKYKTQKSFRPSNDGSHRAQNIPTVPVFANVIKQARKLVSKINTSSVATPRLIALSGKKLLSDVSTRWSSNYLVFSRLYELRHFVNTICEEMGWDSLSVTSWGMLKNIIDLLEPFAAFTQLVSADKSATFSSAILCIEELKLHLEKCSGITGLNNVATAMLEDLKRRFNFMSDEKDPDFDGSYLLATCLDCNHRIHVIEDLNIQSLVVKHVVNIAKQMGLPYSATPTPGTQPSNIPTSSDSTQALEDTGYNNLNTSTFRLLMKKRATRLSNESSSRSSSAMSGSSTSSSTQLDPEIHCPNIEKELKDYLHFANHEFDLSKDPPVQDVISYWKDLSSRFPYLSKLAFNLLVIPVSSASSEREFSIAGWHCLGRKNRTEEEVLAAKVFLTCNRDLLRPLLF